jgi:hypothetical protein
MGVGVVDVVDGAQVGLVICGVSHDYSTGVGGGALIVDKFGDDDEKPQEKSSTGQRRAAD